MGTAAAGSTRYSRGRIIHRGVAGSIVQRITGARSSVGAQRPCGGALGQTGEPASAAARGELVALALEATPIVARAGPTAPVSAVRMAERNNRIRMRAR
jgi:hypothetical protein